MRLDFVILWFENQPRDVQTQMEEIKDHIREVGFKPIIQIEENGNNLERLSENQELFNDYDLVVVDYDLGVPGRDGDHVAQIVRSRFGFTDIIFYSGNSTTDLRWKIHDRQIDGVYCMHRPDLTDRLTEHIDQVVNRLSRLESMRGLAMGTVGKCDDTFRDMLLHVYNNAENLEQSSLINKIDEYVENAKKHQTRKYRECTTFEEKLSSRAVTSFHLQKLALHCIKCKNEYSEYHTELKNFCKDVLEPRNVLGHAVETRDEDGWTVTSEGKPPIQTRDFPELRSNMTRHLENILNLYEKIIERHFN